MPQFAIRLEVDTETESFDDMQSILTDLAQEYLCMMSASVIEVYWDGEKNKKVEKEAKYFEVV